MVTFRFFMWSFLCNHDRHVKLYRMPYSSKGNIFSRGILCHADYLLMFLQLKPKFSCGYFFWFSGFEVDDAAAMV